MQIEIADLNSKRTASASSLAAGTVMLYDGPTSVIA